MRKSDHFQWMKKSVNRPVFSFWFIKNVPGKKTSKLQFQKRVVGMWNGTTNRDWFDYWMEWCEHISPYEYQSKEKSDLQFSKGSFETT